VRDATQSSAKAFIFADEADNSESKLFLQKYGNHFEEGHKGF
jgi:hypothetical protein